MKRCAGDRLQGFPEYRRGVELDTNIACHEYITFVEHSGYHSCGYSLITCVECNPLFAGYMVSTVSTVNVRFTSF